MRAHPHLYELSAWPWLERLSASAGRRVTLGTVPESEWDRLHDLGFDIVYLMGVWRRSDIGRQIARSEPRLFERYDGALPGWTPEDIVGSPYSIREYVPDPRIGTWRDLAAVRRALHARRMQLVLDFVPNHTGFDHPWIASHPHRYMLAELDQFRAAPDQFRAVESHDGKVYYIACGRDPHFPPWTDVAQLNYFEGDTRQAMIAQLEAIAEHCDGVRCDMAMLVLDEVFVKTWGGLVGRNDPPGEFWAEVRGALPDVLLIAEAYWDLEWRLQQLGFSFTYDKRFYDRVVHDSARAVRDHLRAAPEYQNRSTRFLENHDEPRSCAIFGAERIEAAATLLSAVPGMRFYYDGQLEGRRHYSPVQLGRWADESEQPEVSHFYERLLRAADDSAFHEGTWAMLEVAEAGDASHDSLVACRWRHGGEYRLIVANLGTTVAQGHVRVADDFAASRSSIVFDDQLREGEFAWDPATLRERGLYVSLRAGRAHLFVARQPPD